MIPGRFGYCFDARVLGHEAGSLYASRGGGAAVLVTEHPSSARITAAIHQLLEASGFVGHCVPLPALAATVEQLARVHSRDYIALVERLDRLGEGDAGQGAPVRRGSYLAASLSAGSAALAVDRILDGSLDGAYVLARPPGHHAEPGRGMGFCLFNSVAVAVAQARVGGCERVLVVDWDVHHGNGTQAMFYEDPRVLFVSLHQDNWYPLDSGTPAERGRGAGRGTTVNVPLPPGTGDRGYMEALARVVIPAARRFGPELIVVSAGQDGSMLDPLGRMLLSGDGYRDMGAAVAQLADEVCGGRLLLVQEGGYSAAYTPYCTLAALEGVTGWMTGLRDPFLTGSEIVHAHTAYAQATHDAIEAAVAVHATGIG
jgi:acetoin utilization deacetylase AcuC-like enzyme